MMSRVVGGVLLSSLFLLVSCATMQKPEVQPVDDKPRISKTISQAPVGAKTGLKRKVAIARFTNETKYGQSFFIDENKDRIGKQAVDILSAKLLQTDKFIMLERADLDKIQKELAIGNMSPLKNMADYLIVGSITEFGRQDTSDVGIFSRVKKQTAYAKVHIRLIDVSTGQILYSEYGEGSAFSEAGTVFGVGARAGYDSTLNDKALDAAITNLSSRIIENLLNKPWRAYIIGYEEGNIIISGGKSQNIAVGNIFDVYVEGKKVKNPQTNMMITLPGRKIAAIRVVQCLGSTPEDEVSLCEIASGIDSLSPYLKSKDFNNLYIGESQQGAP
jgi:curli biogenesis system outer membrane secretion channel CsgG